MVWKDDAGACGRPIPTGADRPRRPVAFLHPARRLGGPKLQGRPVAFLHPARRLGTEASRAPRCLSPSGSPAGGREPQGRPVAFLHPARRLGTEASRAPAVRRFPTSSDAAHLYRSRAGKGRAGFGGRPTAALGAEANKRPLDPAGRDRVKYMQLNLFNLGAACGWPLFYFQMVSVY